MFNIIYVNILYMYIYIIYIFIIYVIYKVNNINIFAFTMLVKKIS